MDISNVEALNLSVAPGTRLGQYEVVSALGAGGMGEVYRARDAKLGRDVAIKVLPAELADNPDALARFEREARAVAQLSHPNILAIFDFGRQDETAYAVMELLEGETLRARLDHGALPARKAVDLAVQIAEGLAAAHEKGIVHRDLKPENVFVTHEGRAKLLDFGLAKTTGPASGQDSGMQTVTQHTGPGTVMGTVGYMSPEQVRGEAADHRSDIFSFGAVLYEMLAGRRAFRRETAAESMTAILKEDAPEVAASGPGTSPALQRIVQHCLEKKPGERFQSARDIAFALQAPSGSAVASASAPVLVRRRVREVVAWAAFLIALVAALVLWLWSSNARPQPAVTVRSSILTPDGLEIAPGGQVSNGPAAISPDGRILVLPASSKDRGVQLWIRPLDAAETRPLPGTEQASYPFWSPDSKSVAFFAGGKLKRVPVTGGEPVVLADAPTARGGAWSRDGTILYAPTTVSGLHRVPADGGAPRAVTHLDESKGQTSHRFPCFLPDGRHFLYYAYEIDPMQMEEDGPWDGIYIGSVDGGGSDRFLVRSDTNAQYASSHILFMRQSTLLAVQFDPQKLTISGEPSVIVEDARQDVGRHSGGFTVSEGGTLAYHPGKRSNWTQLAWLDRSGRPLGSVGEPGILGEPELSPDGKRAAVSVLDATSRIGQIWIYDLASGGGSPFTFGSIPNRFPIWSADGSHVYFASNRKGPGELYVKPSAGAGKEEMVFDTERKVCLSDCSRDGRFLLFTLYGQQRGEEVWALSLFGEKKPAPLSKDNLKDPVARLSPDSRWIACDSYESGRAEIYVAAFPGPGGKWQVSTGGGTAVRWRRDGKELYFVSGEDELMAVAVQAGTSFEHGTPRPLFKLPPIPNTGYWYYDVSPDGDKFLFTYPVVTKPEPLALIQNWTAALGK